jgi:hypothetical protein
MEEMIARCGLICTKCPAYIATKENDAVKAAGTAEQWAKDYGITVTIDDVWCDGCLDTGGKKCAHCHTCEIRACAMEKNAANCGWCDDFPCQKIEVFLKMAPPARAVLVREVERKAAGRG